MALLGLMSLGDAAWERLAREKPRWTPAALLFALVGEAMWVGPDRSEGFGLCGEVISCCVIEVVVVGDTEMLKGAMREDVQSRRGPAVVNCTRRCDKLAMYAVREREWGDLPGSRFLKVQSSSNTTYSLLALTCYR